MSLLRHYGKKDDHETAFGPEPPIDEGKTTKKSGKDKIFSLFALNTKGLYNGPARPNASLASFASSTTTRRATRSFDSVLRLLGHVSSRSTIQSVKSRSSLLPASPGSSNLSIVHTEWSAGEAGDPGALRRYWNRLSTRMSAIPELPVDEGKKTKRSGRVRMPSFFPLRKKRLDNRHRHAGLFTASDPALPEPPWPPRSSRVDMVVRETILEDDQSPELDPRQGIATPPQPSVPKLLILPGVDAATQTDPPPSPEVTTTPGDGVFAAESGSWVGSSSQVQLASPASPTATEGAASAVNNGSGLLSPTPCVPAVSPPKSKSSEISGHSPASPGWSDPPISETPNPSGSQSVGDLVDTAAEGGDSAKKMFQLLLRHGCIDLSSHMDPDHPPEVPINGGGRGDIWQGKMRDGTAVAIKVWRLCSMEHNDPSQMMKRAAQEIYHWSKAKHENIHELMGVILFKERLGMVSQWMENGNLRDFLYKNPHCDRYSLCTQVATGVHYLHSQEMVHGDLKAVNVLMSQDGVAKLSDFDNSIMPEISLVFSDYSNKRGGTTRWMAPELIDESNIRRNAHTDIYALGMTMLEIITGSSPYYPKYRRDCQVIRAVMEARLPERQTSYFGDNARGNQMWELLLRCWDRKPTDRPTATEVLEALGSLAND